ncbi:hypothetical protein AGMMS49928_08110 [Spirochaetia bacterium]|nr:hypothetical protein AGMMS49928_08110 [Spirochaetia bacterium]
MMKLYPLKPVFFQFLVIFLLLCAFAPLVPAGGSRDTSLSRADALINNKLYDEAIQVLTVFAKDNPNKFDAVQKRLQRIVKIRNRYNTIADELLDTMTGNPENSEKILALSRQLENLESVNNPASRQFLDRTKTLALFAYNRERLEQILAEGRDRISRGDYAAAFAVYASGLDIYQEEFFSGAYGTEAEDTVHRGLREIRGSMAAFSAVINPVNASLRAFEQLERQGQAVPARFSEQYRRLEASLEQLIALRSSLALTGAAFEQLLTRLRENDPGLGDQVFLSFAIRLLDGALGAADEGMIGVVDSFWKSTMSRIEGIAADMANRSYTAALGDLSAGNYGKMESRLAAVTEYLRIPLDIISHPRQFYEQSGLGFETIFGQSVTAGKAEGFIVYEAMTRLKASLAEAGRIGLQFGEILGEDFSSLDSWRSGALSAEAAEGEEGKIRQNLEGISRRMGLLTSRIVAERLEFRLLKEQRKSSGEQDSIGYFDDVLSRLTPLNDTISTQYKNSVIRYYTIVNGEFKNLLSLRQEEFDRGKTQIEGVERTLDDGTSAVAFYPSEGLVVLARLALNNNADTAAARALQNRYMEEMPSLREEREVKQLEDDARSLAEQLRLMQAEGAALSALARTKIAQAEAFRLDGDRLYREAQESLYRNDFDAAREKAERASERYNASVTIQESAPLRRDWDTRLVNLGAEIKREENESIVREVRLLVNNARNTYFAGNFEQAEDFLVRARNRWLTANGEEDTEISYWLTMVRGALSLQSGRVIPVTAPLYAEMSQLLSDAHKKFNEGLQFFNTRQRNEGLIKFSEVRQKTREVKLMFPLNQEAGILELRMDQVTDPPAFNESFAQRLREAVAGTAPNRRSVEAFADLQNLAEINPRYPGIREAVFQAEINMGNRLPPPDPQSLDRARDLVQQAQGIINTNARSQFPIAMEQLSQALRLDPNSAQAMFEKDRLQTLIGGEGSIILDSADEQEYQRAVRELQQRNNLTALAIVQRLLEKPKNKNSPKILELQRRIESAL